MAAVLHMAPARLKVLLEANGVGRRRSLPKATAVLVTAVRVTALAMAVLLGMVVVSSNSTRRTDSSLPQAKVLLARGTSILVKDLVTSRRVSSVLDCQYLMTVEVIYVLSLPLSFKIHTMSQFDLLPHQVPIAQWSACGRSRLMLLDLVAVIRGWIKMRVVGTNY